MTAFLNALSIQNYRGIGADHQFLRNLKKINFFIGPNNSGKSTVLNLISRHLPLNTMRGQWQPKNQVDALERFGGMAGPMPEIGLGFSKNDIAEKLWNPLPEKGEKSYLKDQFSKFLDFVADGDDFIWHRITIANENKWNLVVEKNSLKQRVIEERLELDRLHRFVTSGSGGAFDSWLTAILNSISNSVDLNLPETRIIPAIRQIGPKGNSFDKTDFSGVGLIDRLAEAQSPDYDKPEDLELFERVNSFVQIVTGESTARIKIPHGREHVLVQMNGRTLPLSSLGTGIHEVIMIAAFCTLCEDEIICIEEPELHLHPTLQRKLIRHLIENTNNQYFIATHSASFIDTPDSAIFHVRLEDNLTAISRADLDRERFEICLDLGHRASDIIQSNAIVWVEGPSDRIYLKHWIEALAPELREGTHYSIMFYGGRLLNHLSADDEDIQDFIKLRALNRHVALIMDSDRDSADKAVGATKRRLISEFKSNGGVAWLTKGREIENYVPHQVLQEAVAEVYGERYVKPSKGGQYDHALYFYEAPPKKRRNEATKPVLQKSIDKVRVARAVCKKPAILNVLDLKDSIAAVVKMIQRSNGI